MRVTASPASSIRQKNIMGCRAKKKKTHRRAAWTKAALWGGHRNSREGLQLDSNLFAAAWRCQQNFGGSRLCETAQRGETYPPSPKGATAVLRNSFPLLVSHFFSSPAGNFIFRRRFLRRPPWPLFPPPRPSQAKRCEGKRNERLTTLARNLSG